LLLDAQLRGILDHDDAFVVGDRLSKNVEQGCLAGPGSTTDKDGLAALNLSGQELRKRARERPASDQVFNCEMAAGELADDHGGSGANDWGNYGCQAASIGELRVEERVIFVELLAELIGDYFKARAQSRRVELNARVVAQNAIAFIPPCRVGITDISLTLSSSKSGSMGRRNGRISSKLMRASRC